MEAKGSPGRGEGGHDLEKREKGNQALWAGKWGTEFTHASATVRLLNTVFPSLGLFPHLSHEEVVLMLFSHPFYN